MHYAIIAAGEGSRLSDLGPKPLVSPAGETLVGRLLRMVCSRPDARSVTVVTNARTPEVAALIATLELHPAPEVIEARTDGALRSLELAAGGRECVALTVDSVFSPTLFNEYADEFAGGRHECLMAVSGFIDDEKPLYVSVDGDGCVTSFDDTPGSPLVSAGVYGLGDRAMEVLAQCRAEGVTGLREFQRRLVAEGVDVRAFNIGKAIDVDRPADVVAAREFLTDSDTEATWRE